MRSALTPSAPSPAKLNSQSREDGVTCSRGRTGDFIQLNCLPMIQLPSDAPPQFSGHETFPLRQLWLRKAYDAVTESEEPAPRSVFADEDAIVRFGVGKNMAMSIRFWATACGVIEDQGGYMPTRLGRLLFDDKSGLDRYCEHTATTWLNRPGF